MRLAMKLFTYEKNKNYGTKRLDLMWESTMQIWVTNKSSSIRFNIKFVIKMDEGASDFPLN